MQPDRNTRIEDFSDPDFVNDLFHEYPQYRRPQHQPKSSVSSSGGNRKWLLYLFVGAVIMGILVLPIFPLWALYFI